MRRSAAEEETCESETRAERGRVDKTGWRWSGSPRQGVNRDGNVGSEGKEMRKVQRRLWLQNKPE